MGRIQGDLSLQRPSLSSPHLPGKTTWMTAHEERLHHHQLLQQFEESSPEMFFNLIILLVYFKGQKP